MEVENTENYTVVELIPADVKVAAKRGSSGLLRRRTQPPWPVVSLRQK